MTILKAVLVFIGVVFCIFLFGGPNAEAESEVRNEFMDGWKLGAAIGYTRFIIIAGVGLILAFFIVQLITNTKKTLFSIIGLVVALIIYLIFLAMGSNDTNESLKLVGDVMVEDQSTISSTTAGIYTLITCIVIGAAAVVWGAVKSLSKGF